MPENRRDNWILKLPGEVERFEANFTGNAYSSHRHEEYTVALTTRGVQRFNYRGQLRYSLPGQAVILHPDELHDGSAGTDDPFGYRAITINPNKIQEVLEGGPLPFIEGGVVTTGKILEVTKRLLEDYSCELSFLEYEGLVFELVDSLNETSINVKRTHKPNYNVIKVVREFIEEHFLEEFSLDELSKISGYTKWQLSRDFKSLFGISPYQYVLFLRLTLAKKQLTEGQDLLSVTYSNGFSDQSHFTRKFKQRFGVTPKKWINLLK